MVLTKSAKKLYNLYVTTTLPISKGTDMYTIGIDLGGTNIAVGLCDEKLNILDKLSISTPAKEGAEAVTKAMAEATKNLLERNSVEIKDIEYLGMAVPGSIDPEMGVVEYSNNIPFENFPIAERFRSYIPIEKIYVENDANAAALAEALSGSAKDSCCSVMITLGTGVGGGVIINGKIFKGGINAAGAELGHTVIQAGGRLCTCGRRGCLETYASATGLVLSTKEKLRELEILGVDSKMFEIVKKYGKINGRIAFDAARLGDAQAKAVVDEYVYYLAEGITNMVNIFQPAVVSIGGGISGEGEFLLEPLRKAVYRDQYTRIRKIKAKIVAATLGNDAGIIGAAGLGR